MNWKRNGLFLSVWLVAASILAAGARRIDFSVTGYKGTETLTGFPVLVRLSEATIPGFRYADCTPDGSDLTFSLQDRTVLPREIERWDPSGESLVWVRLPELKQGTSFRCHFGDKEAVDQPPCQDDGSVWTGYAGVWHFSEPEGTAFDSTANGLDAVPQGRVEESVAVEGVVGKGRQNAATSYNKTRLLVPSYDDLAIGGHFTVSSWFYAEAGGGGWMRLWSRKISWNEQGGWELELAAGDCQSYYAYGTGSKDLHGRLPASLKAGWQHVVLAYNANSVSLYVNGDFIASNVVTEVVDNGKELAIGGNVNGGSAHFRGGFDEMRLFGGVASADRIRAGYDTMASADFLSAGAGVVIDTSTFTIVAEPQISMQGVAEPAAGTLEGLASGDSLPCSLRTGLFFPAEGVCAVSQGWRLYAFDGASGAYLPVDPSQGGAGTGLAVQYRHPDPANATKLAWLFAISNLVTATPNDPSLGSVDKPESWVLNDGTLALTARPGEGSAFIRWRGDLPAGADPSSPVLTLTVDRPLSLVADFASNLYVSPNGDDANDGRSWEAALANPQTAMDRAHEDDVIHVDDGVYCYGPTSRDGAILTIDKNVFVVSRNGPGKTVFDGGRDNKVNCRGLTISNAAPRALFSGFTITNGSQRQYYVASSIQAAGGVVSNCVVHGCYQTRSAFVELSEKAVMRNSVIDAKDAYCGNFDGRNAAIRLLGESLLENSVVRNMRCGNKAYAVRIDDEDVFGATVRGCVISNNLVGNVSSGSGEGAVFLYDGILENCTIVGNESYGNGAGVYIQPRWNRPENVVCRNNIIWGNRAAGAFQDIYGNEVSGFGAGVAENCCASDLPFGERGNTNLDPLFLDYGRGDLRIDPASPCVDMALEHPWMAGALDFLGAPRVFGKGPDIGAFESQEKIQGIAASIGVKASSGRVPFVVEFVSNVVGDKDGLTCRWDFGDGTGGTGLSPVHTYEVPGAYDISLVVENAAGERCEVARPGLVTAVPKTCYVSPAGGHRPPFMTWETASTNIESALALAPVEVLVTNGVYIVDPAGLSVPADVTLRSVNGPTETCLDTGLEKRGENRRLLFLQNEGVVVSGFTLRHGCTSSYYFHSSIFASAGTVTNCLVKDNLYMSRSAIVYLKGTARLVDCTIEGTEDSWNTDSGDNGAISMYEDAVVENCIITNFVMTSNAGISCPCAGVILHDRTVLRNSLVVDCDIGIKRDYGRGATNLTGLASGVVVQNGTPTVENCTIVGNRGAASGAGLSFGQYLKEPAVIRNNIIWGNSARGAEQDVFIHPDGAVPAFVANCTPVRPHATATGTITADPLFRPGSWTLGFASPCINAGVAADWMTEAVDLAGNPRIRNRLPDLGCYEGLLPGGTLIILR